MEDRYIELKDRAVEKGTFEAPKKVSMGENLLKTDFQEKLKVVQNNLGTFTKLNQQLKKLESDAKKATTAEEEKKLSAKIEIIVNEGRAVMEQNKGILDILNKEAEKNKKENPTEPETRAMFSAVKALGSRFASALKDNQKLQVELQTQIKDKVKRQVRVVDNKLSPEEVEQLSENPQAFQEMIQLKTLGKAHLKVYYGVEDIMEKYKGITKLETSINYILQLLDDIAIMVQTQGELLDSIQTDLEKAENYMKRANKALVAEKQSHKGRRARYCCIMLVILIIGGVVAVSVVKI